MHRAGRRGAHAPRPPLRGRVSLVEAASCVTLSQARARPLTTYSSQVAGCCHLSPGLCTRWFLCQGHCLPVRPSCRSPDITVCRNFSPSLPESGQAASAAPALLRPGTLSPTSPSPLRGQGLGLSCIVGTRRLAQCLARSKHVTTISCANASMNE